jgi:site-specific DNA recombinase
MAVGARRPVAAPTERVEVWAYARYSSDKQNDRSIEDQIRECSDTCGHLQLPPPSRTFADRARSGKAVAGRADLQKMLAEAAKLIGRGNRRVLVVESLDRLGRNLFDSFDVVRRLHREAGFRIVTADGRDSDNAAFKAMLLADSFVADVFLDNLRAHTKRGLLGRARAGCWVCGPPLGYRMSEGRLVVDENTAPIVRRMFELAATGASLRSVASELEAAGMLPGRKKYWSGSHVKYRLRNRVYIGEVWYGGELMRRDESLRLVSDGTWEKANDFLHQRTKEAEAKHRQGGTNLLRGGGLRKRHLLSSLFRCAACGGPLTLSTGGHPRYWYYGCPAARTRGACSNRSYVPGAATDRAVLDAVLSTVFDKRAIAYIVREVEERITAGRSAEHGERRRTEQELERIRNALRRCQEQIENHGPSRTMQQRIAELEGAESKTVDQLRSLCDRAPDARPIRSAVMEYLEQAAELLQGVPELARQALLQVVTDATIAPLKRGEFRIRFRVAPIGLLRDFAIPGGRGNRPRR